MTDVPTIVLPDGPMLDPLSAAQLALHDELERQLAAMPDGDAERMVALDLAALARAALGRVEGLPRIPEWIEARRIGGVRRAGNELPEVEIGVDVGADGQVVFTADTVRPHDTDETTVVSALQSTTVPATDAELWFLNGLAACVAARRAQDQDPG